MTYKALFERIKIELADDVIDWTVPESDRLDATLLPHRLPTAVLTLQAVEPFYLAAITGMDNSDGLLAVLYHFCSGAAVVTLRVMLEEGVTVPSICDLIPYASPFERETAEMFGITFAGAPDASRLFLPDDWDTNVYPLRKNAVLEEVHDDNAE